MGKLWKIIDIAVKVYEQIRDLTKRKKPEKK